MVKHYHGLRPLRVSDLRLHAGERLALGGFDATTGELFVNLVTGTFLPDEGDVRVFGGNTRDLATDAQWLESLDRLGIVTHRATFLDGMSVLQNLALPLTLEIDPVTDDVREHVTVLAREVAFDEALLDGTIAAVTPLGRARLHLARALALDPDVLLVEHPTAMLGPDDVVPFARTMADVAERRGVAVVVLTVDAAFAAVLGARHLTLQPATGALAAARGWKRWFTR